MIVENGQRSRKPVCRLVLVTEYGNCMRDHGNKALDWDWGRHDFILLPIDDCLRTLFRRVLAAFRFMDDILHHFRRARGVQVRLHTAQGDTQHIAVM